jgi:hypothetical protein
MHIQSQTQNIETSNILTTSDSSDSDDDEEIKNIQTDTMIHNFLNASKISDYENTVYSVAPGQDYHPLGLFKDKNSEELNFPTLFYGQPRNPATYENLTYQQIAQWELLHKSSDFSTNIPNLFFKAAKISIQKVKQSASIRI